MSSTQALAKRVPHAFSAANLATNTLSKKELQECNGKLTQAYTGAEATGLSVRIVYQTLLLL
jgi:hypothetical protein